jgi:hypothetical protein
MTSRSRRVRLTLRDADVKRLEGLAVRSGLSFAAEASLLLVVGITMAERRWQVLDGIGDGRTRQIAPEWHTALGEE